MIFLNKETNYGIILLTHQLSGNFLVCSFDSIS